MSVAHMPKNILSGFVDLKGNGQQQYGPAATSAAQNKAGLQPKMNMKKQFRSSPHTHMYIYIYHIIQYIYIYMYTINQITNHLLWGSFLGTPPPSRNDVK